MADISPQPAPRSGGDSRRKADAPSARIRRAERAKSARLWRAVRAPSARLGRALRAHRVQPWRVRRAGTAGHARRRTARGGGVCPVLLVSLGSPRLRSVKRPKSAAGIYTRGYIGGYRGGYLTPFFDLTRRHFGATYRPKKGGDTPPILPLYNPYISPKSAETAPHVRRATPPHAPRLHPMGSQGSP